MAIFLFATLFVVAQGRFAEGSDLPIVILKSSDIEPYRGAAKGAVEMLGGRKAVMYDLEGNPDRIIHVMEKVSLLSPKAVVAIGSLAVLALKTNPVNVPVVVCLVVNHSEALQKIPRSWSVSMQVPAEEAYERIQQVLPQSRIGVPYDPDRTGEWMRELLGYFNDKPVRLVPIIVRSPSELGPSLIQNRSGIDALWILPDASFLDPLSVTYLLRYSIANALPIFGYSEGFSKSGALLSFAGDYEDMGRQAADLALQVSSGENPPRVQHPRELRTFINLQVARRLNIPVAQSLVALAERVYP